MMQSMFRNNCQTSGNQSRSGKSKSCQTNTENKRKRKPKKRRFCAFLHGRRCKLIRCFSFFLARCDSLAVCVFVLRGQTQEQLEETSKTNISIERADEQSETNPNRRQTRRNVQIGKKEKFTNTRSRCMLVVRSQTKEPEAKHVHN